MNKLKLSPAKYTKLWNHEVNNRIYYIGCK